MNNKVKMLGLSAVAATAIGSFIGASLSSNPSVELAVADASTYTAEINTSTKIVKSLSSKQRYGFQLHGGENYGLFAQKSEGCIEVHDSGDYVISLLPKEDDNHIQFTLDGSKSRTTRIGEDEWVMLNAFPNLQVITVTLDKDVTGFSLYGYSGAEDSFDYSEQTKGNLKMCTLTRNSTPLKTGQAYGYYVMLERAAGGSEPINIRNISLTYTCGS